MGETESTHTLTFYPRAPQCVPAILSQPKQVVSGNRTEPNIVTRTRADSASAYLFRPIRHETHIMISLLVAPRNSRGCALFSRHAYCAKSKGITLGTFHSQVACCAVTA